MSPRSRVAPVPGSPLKAAATSVIRPRRSGLSWSAGEVEKLRALAGRKSVSEIAQSLSRSRGATTAKAFQLRLSLQLPKSCRLNSRVGWPPNPSSKVLKRRRMSALSHWDSMPP